MIKQITIAVLLLITVSQGMAQKFPKGNGSNGFYGFSSNEFAVALWHGGSDTLEIPEPLKVHFIKIGEHVYQITEHAPTINEVEKQPRFFTLPQGFLNGTTPTKTVFQFDTLGYKITYPPNCVPL